MEEQLQFPNPIVFSTYNSTPSYILNPNCTYTLTCQPLAVREVFLSIDSHPAHPGADCPTIKTPTKLPTYLEDNLNEVNFTVARGCFCRSKNCLDGLDPEMVYRHRKNVSKLSKADHSMFLMGIMTACLSKTKGQAQKYIKYMFEGRRVCREAFMYLQCCTYQQLMEIRDHLTVYGVSHVTKNSVKNCITYTDGYKHMKRFLDRYVECHVGKENVSVRYNVILPLGTTKKSVHQSYKAYMERYRPGVKCFSYGTFSGLLTSHFPNIIFFKFGMNVPLRLIQIKDEKLDGEAEARPLEDKKFNARV